MHSFELGLQSEVLLRYTSMRAWFKPAKFSMPSNLLLVLIKKVISVNILFSNSVQESKIKNFKQLNKNSSPFNYSLFYLNLLTWERALSHLDSFVIMT